MNKKENNKLDNLDLPNDWLTAHYAVTTTLKSIFYRLEELNKLIIAVDEQQLHTHDCLLDYGQRIKNLENKITFLKDSIPHNIALHNIDERVCELEGLTNAMRERINNFSAPALRKEPFICPKCDGNFLAYNCQICNKGIVWG